MRHLPAPALAMLALCAWVVGTAGCASIENAERSSRLNDSLRVYEKLVRWGEYTAAVRYVRHPPDHPAPPPALPELLRSIHVTHYQLVGLEMNPELTEASVSHAVRFYHEDNQRVVTLVDRQRWWWDDETSQWYLDGGLPDFASALRAKR